MPLSDLIGASLQGKDGEVDTASLQADYVGIYFSAHWCPPCKQFTPMLASFYNTHKDAKKFEIVFASSDRDQKSFDEYYGEMPWLAIPFSDRATKDKLSKTFKVGGIPTLVIVDKNGEVVTTKARGDVMSDAEGANFPWRPKTFKEIMAENSVIRKDGSKVSADEAIAGKSHIGLYFSAHWCPPCRRFTPVLGDFYNDKERSPSLAADALEILFVSADKDQSQFNDYHGEQPWPAFEFGTNAKDDLMGLFDVEGFPTFVVVDPDGKVICEDARSRVESSPKEFPWPAKPVEDLGVGMGIVNDGKLAILLTDKDPSPEAATQNFAQVAQAFFDEENKDDDDDGKIAFTQGGSSDDMVPRIRQFFGLSEDADGSSRVVVTDIPNRCKYVATKAEIQDAAALSTFMNKVKAGTAKAIGLQETPARE